MKITVLILEDHEHAALILAPLARLLRLPVAVNRSDMERLLKEHYPGIDVHCFPDKEIVTLAEKSQPVFVSCYTRSALNLLFESRATVKKNPFASIFVAPHPFPLDTAALARDCAFLVFNKMQEVLVKKANPHAVLEMMGSGLASYTEENVHIRLKPDSTIEPATIRLITTLMPQASLIRFAPFSTCGRLITDDEELAALFLAYRRPIIFLRVPREAIFRDFPLFDGSKHSLEGDVTGHRITDMYYPKTGEDEIHLRWNRLVWY
ncbi:MAG: hypothetical protein A3F09_01970 [Chlamydiae bacterium RIFCSPHIGHO2_12_FULL_49_11]|nr:MAG: hypothetical protein A3F09_01970 [Chlamydiae bacterium RIFCSPHIGHO2_12_FULL_49_11]